MRYGYPFRRIPLTQGQYAIVDPERYEELAKHKWYTVRNDGRYYAVRWVKNKNVKMHQVIMGVREEGKVIDHVNGNGLDNRQANVRFATSQQNGWNKRKQRGNYSSQYKGVSWDKNRNVWRARIKYKGRSIHLGRFDTEEKAGRAYDAKARELFGEFAWLNFPERPGVGRRKSERICIIKWVKRLRFAGKVQWFAKFFA